MMRFSASTSGRADGVTRRGDVQHVEKHDEDAVVRIGRQRSISLSVVRIAPLGFGEHRFDAHELDVLDGLRLAVLEDLEVRGLQALDDLPSRCG